MVQPVKAVTVDNTEEMILVPVLDSETNVPRVTGAILSVERESLIAKIDVRWIKESQIKTVRIHFAEP